MMLTACSKSDSVVDSTSEVIESFVEGEYSILMPYELSEARYWHGNALSKFDSVEVEKGLNRRTQEFFSTSDYVQSAGLLLDADSIQMLQRRESADYAYALNPSLGDFSINDAITVESPYIVYDVIEVNYYHKDDLDTLAGIGLTILMNSDVSASSDSQSTIEIPKDRLYTFGSNAGRKLESYIRQLEGVSFDCPIYIGLYSSAASDSSVPGVYIGEAFFEDRSGQFSEIHEEWALFPSSLAESMDATTYSQFVSIKNEIADFLPENVDIIGLGRFEDDQLQDLKIDINVQAKTYNEINALAQLVSKLCDTIDSTSINLSIDIKMFDTTYFTLIRKEGESEISIHDIS